MAQLHRTLEALAPRDFSEVPLENLSDFLTDTFEAAEEIINSVPPPPSLKDACVVLSHNNLAPKATSAAEVVPSLHRLPPVHPEHEALREKWGKPLKLGAKENPVGLTMYKMAANDRNGAWFGRRSVHEGVSFDRWKEAMQSEFAESLAVTGGPGSGSIRGIGADRLLERKKVPEVGKLEVYQLSAQFPGPTAPRDFVTLLLTTDSGLTEKSAAHEGDQKIGDHIPRHYMVVSIPIDHPDAPPRTGLVRGRYESVEMIREVIPHKPSPIARSSQVDVSSEPIEAKSDNESTGRSDATEVQEMLYPVEWCMITRSDPGGGIPRFMVERGTPGSIAGDAAKFLDWATAKEEFLVVEDFSDVASLREVDRLEVPGISRKLSNSATYEPSQPTDTGIISSLTSVVKDGIASYVPDSVQNGIASIMPGAQNGSQDSLDDSSETSSLDSWASAEQFTTAPDAMPPYMKHNRDVSLSSTSVASEAASEKERKTESRLDQELTKLESKRKELDAKFIKSKEREIAKANDQISKDKREEARIRQRLEREKVKQEERYNKELKKLEDKKKREERKAEERKKKIADGDALSRMTRERDQAKRMSEVLRRENDIWRERVGELQKENTLLVARISRVDGGHGIIKEVRQAITDGDLKRTASPVTGSSKSTKESSKESSTS